MKKKERLRAAEEKNMFLSQQYALLQQNYTANAALFHDMDHHLQVIYHMAGKEDCSGIRSYIMRISRPVRDLEGCIWTGVDVVDAILNQKQHLAQEKGYSLDINAQLPFNTGIATDDFCSILCNLLDNAIEAMDTAKEQLSDTALTLTLRRINHFVLIQVRNPCPVPPPEKRGFFPTRKKNGLHGWGLKNVQRAAARYDGTLHCEVQDGCFTASAMLFFPEEGS